MSKLIAIMIRLKPRKGMKIEAMHLKIKYEKIFASHIQNS